MATLASGLSAGLGPGGTYTRWISSRSFTVSSSVPPLPSFSQRDDNVGAVKHFSSVLVPALGRARHFALVEELSYQPRLARNRFQVRNSVRPMHLFGRNFDHDYHFRLPSEGERDAQSTTSQTSPEK